jgi:hypothetical protein
MKTFIQYIQEEKNKKDSITFDIPLLIRVLELAREDVKDDMEIHRIVERLLDIRSRGILTMDDYNFISGLKEHYVNEMAAGAVSGGPTNVTGPQSATDPVSSTAVDMRKRKKHNPLLINMDRRKSLQ